MGSLGYVGIAGLVAVENLIPPIPSEVVLPLAGFFVSRGDFVLWAVILAATVGSVVGAWALYGIGAAVGRERLYGFVDAYGTYLMVGESDLDTSFAWWERHGDEAVFFGRLVPLVRSLISVPAGLAGMDLGRFTLYTALGSGLWNGLLAGLGWYLGEEWKRVVELTSAYEVVAVGIMGLVGVAFLVHRWRERG
jgi:membrane protein DedA with SNARE-associated domain